MEDTISPAELRAKLRSGEQLTVLDVREPYEFAARHIPHAVNYPVSRLTVTRPDLPKGLVVTVCEHGVRSEAARRLLAKAGYTVMSMRGGMASWTWEVEKGH